MLDLFGIIVGLVAMFLFFGGLALLAGVLRSLDKGWLGEGAFLFLAGVVMVAVSMTLFIFFVS